VVKVGNRPNAKRYKYGKSSLYRNTLKRNQV
jgi:hypothetical protein